MGVFIFKFYSAVFALLATLLLQFIPLTSAKDSEGALRKRYEFLIHEVKRHNELYYQKANPEISDAEYDSLLRELQSLESQHPEWTYSDSPTKRVGTNLKKNRKSFPHLSSMLSIQNTDQIQDVLDFHTQAIRAFGKPIDLCIEEKIDGAAVSLQYERGILKRALTRGDGKTGNDVTHIIRNLELAPGVLNGRAPDILEVRGEFFLPKNAFLKLNEKRTRLGKKPFANPRNAAAGSLNSKNSKDLVGQGFRLIIFSIGYSSEQIASTQSELVKRLSKFGFSVNPNNRLSKTSDELTAALHQIESNASALPYDIDGAVVKIDDLSFSASLGYTEKFPLGMIAYKFSQKQVETRVNDIILQVGRTGLVTPVAILDPVWIDGSTISRVTLHNEKIIQTLQISAGDTVLIEKRGKVIPKILIVTKKEASGKKFDFKNCPECLRVLARRNAKLYCEHPNCRGRLKAAVLYFTGKSGMNIRGFGPALVETLVNAGYIQTLSDIYSLDQDSLVKAGCSEAVSRTLLDQIEVSKKQKFFKFIHALGIPHVGISKARPLAVYFEDLETFRTASKEEFSKVPGIGDVTARSLADYLSHSENQNELSRFYLFLTFI